MITRNAQTAAKALRFNNLNEKYFALVLYRKKNKEIQMFLKFRSGKIMKLNNTIQKEI